MREKLVLPNNKQKLLLHSCCAPCVGELMEALVFSDIDFSILFYNPNIHPYKEYLIRKDENVKYAQKLGIEFIDCDHYHEDRDKWFKLTRGLEHEPERGIRCTLCFDMRFDYSAEYAHKNNFDIFTTSLGISRWKNMEQINSCGIKSANKYKDLEYWTYNWRKKGGSQRMIEISKQENFYQQQYCGCAYSLRDTNDWRVKTGREKVKIGEDYY